MSPSRLATERLDRLWKSEGAPGRKRFERLRPQNRLNKRRLAAAGCRPLPPNSHGKEGVDGSSPSEGFAKFLLIRFFCWPNGRRFWASTSTERPPALRGRPRRGFETLLVSGFTGLAVGVHPGSTALTIASASSTETGVHRCHGEGV
jgi:hypothetical protein